MAIPSTSWDLEQSIQASLAWDLFSISTVSIGAEWCKVWSSNNGITVEFLALAGAFAHKCATANFYTWSSPRFARVNAAGSAAAAGHTSVRICACKIYRDQLVLQVHCLTLVCTQLLEQIKVWAGGWNAGQGLGSRCPPRGLREGPAWRGRALGSVRKTDPYMVSSLALWNVGISKQCTFLKG